MIPAAYGEGFLTKNPYPLTGNAAVKPPPLRSAEVRFSPFSSPFREAAGSR